MTKSECAIISAYTEICLLQGQDLKYLYKYLESISGEVVYTHTIPYIITTHKDRIKKDFEKLCNEAEDR